MEKFRSIKAFKNYKGSRSDEVSPMRILSLLKKTGGGMRKNEIAAQLGVDIETVEKAILQLLGEGVVEIHRADNPKEDLVVL